MDEITITKLVAWCEVRLNTVAVKVAPIENGVNITLLGGKVVSIFATGGVTSQDSWLVNRLLERGVRNG